MRQVKGPPAPAPGKHSLYICWLRKRRHQSGPTFLLMTRAPALVRALQLQGSWRSSAASDQEDFGQSLGQYRHLVAAQEHRGRKQSLPPSPTHPPASACAGLWGQEGALQEGQGMDAGTPVLLTQMGNRKQPRGENMRAFLPMAKGGP